MRDHSQDIAILETVYDLSRLEDPEVSKYLKNKFYIKMSRHSFTLLKYQVDFNELALVMHVMNLNICFHISSEPDLVVDKFNNESILLYEDVEKGGSENAGIWQGSSDLAQLNLGRLAEFYPEAIESLNQAAQAAT